MKKKMTREEAIKHIERMKNTPKPTPGQRAEEVMDYWRKRTKRFETVDDIPPIPCFNEEKVEKAKEYMEFIQNKMIELGAIPKAALIVGHTYLGDCRNAHKAIWKENERFEYMRTKFGCTYPEEINHFQDDDGYDVFTPIKDITGEDYD